MKRKVLKKTTTATVLILAILIISMLFVFAFPITSAKAVSATVTIDFSPNGGSACEPIRTVKYGDSIQLPTSTKLGYNFVGWSLESGNANKIVTNTDLWNKYTPVEENEVLTLYAIWSPKSYKFTFIPDNGYGTFYKYYNVDQSTINGIQLPKEYKLGYRFKGWKYNGSVVEYIDLKNILKTGGDAAANAITLEAQWTPVTKAVAGSNIQNLDAKDMFLDFSSVSSNGPFNYYIKDSVDTITLYGNGKTINNASFVIATRNTALTIVMYNIRIYAPDNTNAIYAEAADGTTLGKVNGKWCLTIDGDTTLNIECIGANNEIRGGKRTYYEITEGADPSKYCSGIVSKNINISTDDLYYGDYDAYATLKVYGGDGYTSATNGGSGIWASYLTIESINMEAYGGDGATGESGAYGTTGATGGLGHNNGYDGGTGGDGGNGGNGRYALNVSHKITIRYTATVKCTGGNGGAGGAGGTGGTGGTGREAAFARYAGNGGNGGQGGNGGNGGIGYAAIMNSAEVVVLDNSVLDKVGGQSGAAGAGGAGGAGGSGGKRLNGTYADSGAAGAAGTEGSAGSSNYGA